VISCFAEWTGPTRGRASRRLGTYATQVVPGGEVLHGLPHFVGEAVELGVDPLLEAGEIGVALREQAVMLQQCTQMLGSFTGHRVETFVRYRDHAVAESAKHFLDLG